MKKHILFCATLAFFVANIRSAEVVVKSPDRHVIVTVTDDGGLNYSVVFDGRKVVDRSRFGIVADGVDLGMNATLGKSSSHKIRETYAIFGGHSSVENYCRETTISIRNSSSET